MSSTISDTNEIKSWYLSNFEAFENSLNGSAAVPFHDVRKAAIARFETLGFPGKRDEEWKYTPVSPILKHKFVVDAPTSSITAAEVERLSFNSLTDYRVVLVNGQFSPELSHFDPPEGVVIGSLAEMLANKSALIDQFLSKVADFSAEPFTALNTAFTHDGVFIYIPDGVVLEAPIQMLYLSDARSGAFFASPRNLIVAGKSAEVKIVEKYAALNEDDVYFNNGVTEVLLHQNAKIEHVRVQDESLSAYHIKNLHVYQEKDSNFTLINIDMGGRLVRNNFNMKLDDVNCEGHLIGAYMATGRQHIDNHTAIDHAKPNCFSNEIYKGILGGKARGVFNGKIFVREDAQKTNAYQDNKALLLSDDAQINTKPQLEIFADDVKCSHGATVGQLDEEALFYLRSRGIPKDKANSMLHYAFVCEALDYVTIEEVRDALDELLLAHFSKL